MKRRKQSRRWRGKKYAPVMIGMLVLLMNLADLKISNLISGSIICQAAERQSENTETENNSGGTEKEKITQTEASTVSDILEELDLSRVQRMLDQMLGEESFSMKDMLDGLIKGEKVLSEDTVQEMVHSFLFSGLEKEKSLLIKILLLILLSAVLANFADVFESGQIGDAVYSADGFFFICYQVRAADDYMDGGVYERTCPGIFPDYIDSGREFDGSGLL